jgi:DNA primase
MSDQPTLYEVVSRYTQLKKAGKQFKGLSPFTREKTPSFFVNPAKGMWYCFSCGCGGKGVKSFLDKIEKEGIEGMRKPYTPEPVKVVPDSELPF